MKLKQITQRTAMLIVFGMAWLVTFAQTNAVSGVVKDAGGEPLIGVAIQEKGTANGSVTDLDGKYSLNVGTRAVLVFSYMGYTSQEIPVSGKKVVNVTMEDDSKSLEELVVVGYGTVRRRDLTGSVASVSGAKLAANPVSNVMQALQGQLPGVNVISQDGRPDASISMRIRGGGSITQSNEPLFVVDGVQVSNIGDIPADNIESIDVLKDAATTAIYGARGANGVILVTTKGAQQGKPTVRYNFYYQTKSNPKTLEVLNAYDYVLWNWSYATSYGANDGQNVAKYFGLGSANGNHLNEYKNVEIHNYVDDLMRTANSYNHDISLTGGSETTKYYASINYSDDEGTRIKSDFSRWNANFKVDQQITKTLSFNSDIRYTQINVNGTQYGWATQAYRYRPIDKPLGEDNPGLFGTGSYNVDATNNPLKIVENYTDVTQRQRLQGRGALNWNIIKGLTARGEISLGKNWRTRKYWDAGSKEISRPYSEARLYQREGNNIRGVATVNYDFQELLPSQHKVSVLLGSETLAESSAESDIRGFAYPEGFTMDDAFGKINFTGITDQSTQSKSDIFNYPIETPEHTQSFFGRANYSFKDRYLLTATFRADGSSNFAPENQWGYFPAGSAAWRISEEEFMKGIDWLDNLKLRLSLGTSGADNIDPGLWKETWEIATIKQDGKDFQTFKPGAMLENRELKWETTVSRNIAVDYGFFKNRIRGSIDAYWNTARDILMKVPVDASSGYSYQFQNVGQTSNKGIEFSLGADIFRNKDWRFDVNFSYTYNHNNVDKLADKVLVDTRTNWGSSMSRPSYDYIIREGQPVGLIQGFKANGFYTVNDFNYDAATQVYTLKEGIPDIKGITNYSAMSMSGFKRPAGQNAFPGMVKFANTDGDEDVDDDDKTIIGKAMPEHTGGLTLNAGYKNLDFSINFLYQIGGSIYNANAMHSMMGNKYDGMGNNRLAFVKNSYKIYDINTNGDLQIVTDPDALNALNANAKYPLNYNEYGLVSSQFVEDASYLRLQNLTVGYSLPKSILEKIKIQNIRLFLTGSNLFCLSGYSGIDPDVNTQVDGVEGFPTPNYDYNSYPKARTFTFGLNVTF